MGNELAKRFTGARTIDASDARRFFREIVDDAAMLGRRSVIMRNGRPLVALVSLADLDVLLGHDRERDRIAARTPVSTDGMIDFDDFVREALADDDVTGRATPGEAATLATKAEPQPLQSQLAEAAMNVITNIVVSRVVHQASKMVVDCVNERLGDDAGLNAQEESKVEEDMLATFNVTPVYGTESQPTQEHERELVEGGG